MTAPTHIISGFAAVGLLGNLSGIVPNAFGLLAVVFGSLLPDIDGRGTITRPGSIFKRFIGRDAARIIDSVFRGLSAMLNAIFGHRGFIHAPALAISIAGAGYLASASWLIWLGFGYLVHLLGDLCTPAGIPIYSPFSMKKVSIANIRVGSANELMLAVLLLFAAIVLGFELLPKELKASFGQLV